MAAHRQVHAHDLVADIKHAKIHCLVCGRACVWLDVCMLCFEQPFCPFYRNIFYLVDKLVAAVVSFSWIALCIFIGERGSHGLKHCNRCMVLRRDHAKAALLTGYLLLDKVINNTILSL